MASKARQIETRAKAEQLPRYEGDGLELSMNRLGMFCLEIVDKSHRGYACLKVEQAEAILAFLKKNYEEDTND